MTEAVSHPGYSAEDLDWLRAQLGIAHLELDPWGSLIVTPASFEHETVIAVLHHQAIVGLRPTPGSVLSPGPAWKVPGGSGYINIADLVVLAHDVTIIGPEGLHYAPPPLLVVEVGSRSTRAVDRGRKLADYRLGGAQVYVLVDPPSMSTGGVAVFEVHDFAGERHFTASGSVDIVIDIQAVRFDLTAMTTPPQP